MGWNSQSVTQLLLVNAGSFFSGVFVYSPGPGTGNLIASIAATNGTDPYGNHYVAGVTSYTGGSGVSYAQLFSGALDLTDSSGNLWQIFPTLAGGQPVLEVTTPAGGQVITNASAGNPSNPGFPEPWHNLSLSLNWGAFAGFHTPRYQLEPVNKNRVRLSGVVQNNTGAAAPVGTVFATLPAGYQPTTTIILPCTGVNEQIQITAAGAISLNQVALPAADGVGLDGITFELD